MLVHLNLSQAETPLLHLVSPILVVLVFMDSLILDLVTTQTQWLLLRYNLYLIHLLLFPYSFVTCFHYFQHSSLSVPNVQVSCPTTHTSKRLVGQRCVQRKKSTKVCLS